MFKHSGRTCYAGFSLCPPLYHIVRFAKLSHSLTAAFDGSVRRFADLIKDNRAAQILRCLGLLPFLLSLILPGRRRTLNLQTLVFAGRCLVGVSRYAPRCESTTAGHPRRSCMPCKTSRIVHGSARLSVCGLLASSKSSFRATWRHRFHNSRLSLLLLLVLRLDKAFLASSTPYCVIASTSSVADGLQALASSPN